MAHAALDRRAFIRTAMAAGAAVPLSACAASLRVGSPNASGIPDTPSSLVVNDVHSQLNETTVAAIEQPRSAEELSRAIRGARERGEAVSIAGGRHAMGGQQFGEGTRLVDTRRLDRLIDLDRDRGIVTVEGGIQWPALVAGLAVLQDSAPRQWGIVQKQTGADRLSLAGALACNAHGRGLTLPPIVGQVEAFELVDAQGDVHTCSRTENADLFRLAIGGYGLFGVITRVSLRLRPRVKVRRVVALADTSGVGERFEERIRAGYLYGDYQFTTDATRDSFLRRGVFSCYEPVPDDTPLTASPTRFHPADWARLTLYAHTHKRRAFSVYSQRYLATSGQVYWADSQLSAAYVDGYHAEVDRAMRARVPASEMITEIYVPRADLAAFMDDARRLLRERKANLIYGTVRLIERDHETFLPWATDRYACIIFNLHVEHSPAALAHNAATFQGLIDLGLERGGRYYLTYHRWARADQVERAYPGLRRLLAEKRRRDPDERFQSTWYRHYRDMFARQG